MEDYYPSRLAATPGWLDRLDPVVHARDRSRAPVAQELIDAFDRDGFVVLDGLLDPSEVKKYKAGADDFRENTEGLIEETVVREPGVSGRNAVRSVFAIHQQSMMFAKLMEDERLAGLARYLLDDDVYIHQSRLNYKPGFCGKEFYWHSDFETWHTEDGMPYMRAVSMSVMLTDNHPQAGPTMFVPGSHQTYVQCVGETPDDHYKTSLRRQEYGVPDADSIWELAEAGIVAPAPKAGSVVVFDCNVLHGSNGNITPYERANAFFVYNAWSNRLTDPYAAVAPRPEFIAHRRVGRPLKDNRAYSLA